jgi:hypothetical protein
LTKDRICGNILNGRESRGEIRECFQGPNKDINNRIEKDKA